MLNKSYAVFGEWEVMKFDPGNLCMFSIPRERLVIFLPGDKVSLVALTQILA